MSCYSSTRRAYILALIEQKETQLDKANATYSALLEKDHESYKFDSGEGSQQVKRVKLSDLKEQIDSLESQIDRLYRRLECSGLVNFNLRRKHGVLNRRLV